SQKRAIDEICNDMRKEKPMNRLLQGDVGSGKSVVMFGASLLAAYSKKQTAIMCPTTTLAEQHFSTLKKYADVLDVKIALLTSASTNVSTCVAKLSSGEIDIVIGTQSLISERVKFKSLGLVVIDEQQKFGVNQRAKLVEKGENVDLLTVTATPIPRSLALILYGEVNVSYISKEIDIKPIKTHIIGSEKTLDCYNFLKSELSKGGFLYVVCPKIYDEELSETSGVIEKFKEIKKVFKDYRVGLLHGDLTSEEREKVTRNLLDDKLDVLVSTSIIEVGIDNQRANLMLIYQAENFGLSSLHQLRGRIGRKGQESFCFLNVDEITEKQKERLMFFKNNTDGFKIADYDLENRGAGEYFGTMQHGKSGNEVFSKMTFEQVKFAKNLAEEIVETTHGGELTLLAKNLRQFAEKPSLN
ncbi:MAG: helicase-related protein, partial [Clostridia bacterium]